MGIACYVGGIAIAVLSGASVIFGLNGVVNVISKIGPIMIVFSVFIVNLKVLYHFFSTLQ